MFPTDTNEALSLFSLSFSCTLICLFAATNKSIPTSLRVTLNHSFLWKVSLTLEPFGIWGPFTFLILSSTLCTTLSTSSQFPEETAWYPGSRMFYRQALDTLPSISSVPSFLLCKGECDTHLSVGWGFMPVTFVLRVDSLTQTRLKEVEETCRNLLCQMPRRGRSCLECREALNVQQFIWSFVVLLLHPEKKSHTTLSCSLLHLQAPYKSCLVANSCPTLLGHHGL